MAIPKNSSAAIPSSSRKSGNGILVMPAMATERSETPGKNFEKRSDTGPTLASRVSVWLTQKSGENETLQSNARMRRPKRRPHQYWIRSPSRSPIKPASNTAASRLGCWALSAAALTMVGRSALVQHDVEKHGPGGIGLKGWDQVLHG